MFKEYEDDVWDRVKELGYDKLDKIEQVAAKLDRQEAESDLKHEIVGQMVGEEDFEGREGEIAGAFKALEKKIVRDRVLSKGVRIDGRGPKDIRALSSEVGVVPRVHGSGLFQRGETQVLGITTLNMLDMEQKLDTLRTGAHEALYAPVRDAALLDRRDRSCGFPKRREVGHGALASRAIVPVLPTREEFPTRSARSARRSVRTVPPRWVRSAPRRCRCSTPVFRSRPRSRVSRWA